MLIGDGPAHKRVTRFTSLNRHCQSIDGSNDVEVASSVHHLAEYLARACSMHGVDCKMSELPPTAASTSANVFRAAATVPDVLPLRKHHPAPLHLYLAPCSTHSLSLSPLNSCFRARVQARCAGSSCGTRVTPEMFGTARPSLHRSQYSQLRSSRKTTVVVAS